MPKKPTDYTGKVQHLTQVLGQRPQKPAKPPRTDTKRYVIDQLREPLLALIATEGYSASELSTLLKKEGVSISPLTLRHYLGPVNGHRHAYLRAQKAQQQKQPRAVPVSTEQGIPTSLPSPAIAPSRNWPPVSASEQTAVSTASVVPSTVPSEPSSESPSEKRPEKPPLVPLRPFIPKPEIPLEELFRRTEDLQRQARAEGERKVRPTRESS